MAGKILVAEDGKKHVFRERRDDAAERIYLEDAPELGIIAREHWTDAKGQLVVHNKLAHFGRYCFAANYVKEGQAVLDIPCGSGYGSDLLASLGASVHGVDIDEKAVEYANLKHSKRGASFAPLDMTAPLPMRDHFWDVVVCFEGLEHIKNGEQLVEELYRILAPGGVALISTPLRRKKKPLRAKYHVREYFAKQFRRLIDNAFDEVGYYVQHGSDTFKKWAGTDNGQTVIAVCHKMDWSNKVECFVYTETLADMYVEAGHGHADGSVFAQAVGNDPEQECEFVVCGTGMFPNDERSPGMVKDITAVEEYRARDLTVEATDDNTAKMPIGGPATVFKKDLWLAHYAENKMAITSGKWKREDTHPEQHDVVYIIGPSPSLEKNAGLIPNIRNGATIGLNGTGAKIDPRLLKYYLTIETELPKGESSLWWADEHGVQRDWTETIAYLAMSVNPTAAKQSWKEIRWFTKPGDDGGIESTFRDEFPGSLLLDAGFTVTHEALALAALMKPKVVVLLGHDSCFHEGRRHVEGERPEKLDKDMAGSFGIMFEGKPYVTSPAFYRIRQMIVWDLYFFLKRGIRVINATEGGILYRKYDNIGKEIERMTLAGVLERYE